eukprot:s518_g13.t1
MVKNEVQVLNSAESAIKCWPSHSIDLAIIMLCRSQNSAGSTSPHAARHHEYQPADISEAELMQHALRLSELEAQQRGHVVAGSLLADHPLQADFHDDDDDRALRPGSFPSSRSQWFESLRIDRERAEQEALRLKQEEERKKQESEELESKAKQAEAAELARQDNLSRKLDEAKSIITPEPPADEAGRLQFQIRIPDGRRLKRAFRPEDSIGQVYAYACVEGGEALVTREFRLVETMPRRTYEDRSITLAAAGLKGQCTLLVEFTDD